jgi:hypothetical protein
MTTVGAAEPSDPVVESAAPAPVARGRGVTGLFAVTMLVGAALSFAVQPMFARIVLPVLGGSAAVWSTSMVFFQATLLVGYAYGHLTLRWLGARRQAALHLPLLLAPLLLLPVGIPAGWVPPVGGSPMLWLLGVLAVTVGPPFVAVAATTPLLSRWYVESGHPRGADPYFLYGASNVGSMLGLLSYPLLVEPVLPLAAQGRVWTYGYLGFVVLVAACARVLWRSAPAPVRSESSGEGERTGWAERLRWLGLAFVPACLLVGMTSVLTTDLAPVPLLWVLPLAVYLLTFVVAFSPRAGAARALLVARRLLPPLVGVALWLLLSHSNEALLLYIPLHLVVFGVAALCCHGRLALERPPAARLTGFYLTLAAGGALGGSAAALVAPVVFDHLLEYPLGLVLAVVALPAAAGARSRRPLWTVVAAVGPPVAAVLGLVLLRHWQEGHRAEIAVLAVAVGAALAPRRRYARGVALAAVFLVATSTLDHLDGYISTDRDFYGTLAVRDAADYHVLVDGTTIHGAQATDPARRTTPLTYFTNTGPLGTVVRTARQHGLTGQVGVIGLGAGTMACQFRAGEQVTFYEIDPLVARVAADPALFSYLRDCPPRTRVVLGDGRLSLAREPAGRYGLVVLDAFASDAVPVHLLTRQAVELYRSKLVPGGLVALNVSNRYLSLEPVLGQVAASLGLTCLSTVDTDVAAEEGKSSSRWVLLAADPRDTGGVRADPRWSACPVRGRVWTDDYAYVLGALHW